ncbi:HicB family protein, partial [Bifidobacteriaceae bacterium WP012]
QKAGISYSGTLRDALEALYAKGAVNKA